MPTKSKQPVTMESRTSQMLATAKRRAGGSVPFTLAELRAHVEASLGRDPRCPYCRDLLFVGNLSLDHKLPVKRGGSHGLENVEYVCAGCNKAKGNLTREEFAAVIRHLDAAGAEARNPRLRDIVLGSMRVSTSFRIGANRRAKKPATQDRG